MKQVVALIQARMGSTRLPGKVLLPIVGKPMLWHIVNRLRAVPHIEEVVVATTTLSKDDRIADFARQYKVACFRGSEDDVLDRYYRAAIEFEADPVIRITADCPLVDPQVVSRLLELYQTGSYDHVGVAIGAGAIFMNEGRFPDGLDAECFSFAALERTWLEATETGDREHVTPYMWRVPGRFSTGTLKSEQDYSHLRWTVDYEADYQLVSQVYEALYREDKPFLMADILHYLESHPELAAINQAFIGKEKYRELWEPTQNRSSVPK